ncbi:MAG: helix-hairpin-helix domain-containing protein [Methylococcales bacterium]|nr:helix-hairpin-helix domain-containing protein [Methylococcales bacterium]
MKKLLIFLALFSFNVLATPVNINKADAKTLSESLKGIGIKRAEAIVKYRSKNGPFKSLDDLRNVKGIGDQIIKNIASDTGLSGSKSRKTSAAKTTKSKNTKKDVEKKTKKAKSTKEATKKDKKAKKSTDKKPKAKKTKKSKKSKAKKTKKSTTKKSKKK